MSRPEKIPIDDRKQVILRAVVNDYVATAEPVGSHSLMSRYQFGVKSATIRNELAELADLGYLYQPHTSAGRVPSDRGYRYYVDRLMEDPNLPSSEAVKVKDSLTPYRTEVDIILEKTCRILSDLAHYTSLATHPSVHDARISHISVARVGRRKLLAVMVLSNGRVVHELLEIDNRSDNLDPIKATNYLMDKLSGRSMEALGGTDLEPMHDSSIQFSEILSKVKDLICREVESASETDIHLEGASYIMQQPEFKDVERLEAVLTALEQRSVLYKLISAAYLGPDVSIIIGSENPVSQMRDCSFVGAKYRVAGRVAGTIGLLGPTRMDYRRAVSAVEFMARNLGDLLTSLSVA